MKKKALKPIGLIVGVIVGIGIATAVRQLVSLSERINAFETINPVFQLKQDMFSQYYSFERIESMFEEVLRDAYTGDFDVDFNNYVVCSIIGQIDRLESEVKQGYNQYLSKEMVEYMATYVSTLNDNNAILEEGSIIYIKVNNFNMDFLSQISRRLSELETSEITIIIDLRDNFGGAVYLAAGYAEIFLEKEKIISRCVAQLDEMVLISKAENPIECKKIFLLVNSNTMSSAEIFVLALSENLDNVLIVGETTGGKGFGMLQRELTDGSLYYLVAFDWFSPLDNNITGVGIHPDIELDVGVEFEDILKMLDSIG